MIGAQFRAPRREMRAQLVEDSWPAVELDGMALTVIEPDRLHGIEPIQCPGQTGRAVLASGKEDERRIFHHHITPPRNHVFIAREPPREPHKLA